MTVVPKCLLYTSSIQPNGIAQIYISCQNEICAVHWILKYLIDCCWHPLVWVPNTFSDLIFGWLRWVTFMQKCMYMIIFFKFKAHCKQKQSLTIIACYQFHYHHQLPSLRNHRIKLLFRTVFVCMYL